jgi:lipopolysaccharide biosynthesis glycosyltransferase
VPADLPAADVVIAFDEHYAMPAAVMLASLERALAAGDRCRVWIAADGIDEPLRQRILHGRVSLDVTWLEIPADAFAHLPGSRHGLYRHIPPTTYVTLLFDRILPPEVTRFAYLDVDVLVRRSVRDLLATDLGVHGVGAVRDFGFPSLGSPGGIANWRALGVDGSRPYLNTGVMLVDRQRWRDQGVGDKAIEYARSKDRLALLDQEALNATLEGRFAELPLCWNFQGWVLGDAAQGALVYTVVPTSAIDAAARDPSVVHYCGPEKPWRHRDTPVAFESEWSQCLAATAWSGHRPPPPSIRRRLAPALDRMRNAARILVKG